MSRILPTVIAPHPRRDPHLGSGGNTAIALLRFGYHNIGKLDMTVAQPDRGKTNPLTVKQLL